MRLRKLGKNDYEKFKELSNEYSLSGDDRYIEKSLSKDTFSNFLTELSKFEKKRNHTTAFSSRLLLLVS